MIGSGEQLWAAVFVGDVADALSRAALDPAAPTGTFALAGPESLTVDAFIDAINHHHVRKRHLRRLVARGLACCLPTLTQSMVDVLAVDSLADGPLITDAFGLERRRVGQVHQDFCAPPSNPASRPRVRLDPRFHVCTNVRVLPLGCVDSNFLVDGSSDPNAWSGVQAESFGTCSRASKVKRSQRLSPCPHVGTAGLLKGREV